MPNIYQTRSQRINRLEYLTQRERQRLQTQFRREASQVVSDIGRAQGLHDRFQPPTLPHPRVNLRGAQFTQPRRPRNLFEAVQQRRGTVEEPPTLLGGVGAEENVPRRHIFGQESQAFAEEVAPREHRKYIIPESQPFGLPGRVAREVTAVDPATIMLAPLLGPNVFGRGALEAAPTLKQLAGTALTAVGADIPVAAGQLGRAGLRALATEAGGVAPELVPRRAALLQ